MTASGISPGRRSPLHPSRFFIFAVSVSLAIWWFRFDYTWAWGDQDEIVPYLLHLIDGDLLAADWFVQTQTESVGVRTPFVLLLRVLSLLVNPYGAILAIFVLAWVAIGWAVFSIARLLSAHDLTAALAVVVVLVLTPKWTLGGNDVVYAMLVPEMAAWSIGLPGVVALMRRRFVLAGLLVGLSGWLQVLVGLHLTLALGLAVVLASRFSPGTTWSDSLRFGVSSLVTMSPMLFVIASQQLASPVVQDPDPTWVLTHFRAPYHYLPTEFSIQSYAKMALVVAAGLLGFGWIKRRGHWNDALRILSGTVAAVGILLVLAYVFVELIPIDLVVKLQLFKLTVIAKVALLATACAALTHVGSGTSQIRLPSGIQSAGVFIGIGLLCVATVINLGRSESRVLESVENWARSSTPTDAQFLIPPSISSFRSRAQRAIVVNYAATPFSPVDLLEWYRRIVAIAPVDTHPLGIELKSQLDDSFHRRTESDWARLAEQFSVDYLVLRQSEAAALPFRIAFRDSVWTVYDLSSSRTR